ncbi:SRPBCC domain-containing protein [Emcibacter sp. SYSU 3D8]|uniref:SRPBCC domain-containing protein n=1 Tax=Emcibacter sp. SYSU 3D8 TaxID=3133969 RepID=UPI0031FEAB98
MTSKVLVSLRVAATPERAFEAFTREIGLWWRHDELFAFSHRRSGTLHFEPGLGGRLLEVYGDGDVFEIGRITIWEPGRRLCLTWRQASFAPGQMTRLEVRFEPVDAGTRVTIEHSGWDTIPQAHAARHNFPLGPFQQRQAEHWQRLLASLAHVAIR